MKKKIWIVCLGMIGLTLSACGPMYKTDYSYIPPQGQMGQVCISQCMQTQSMCSQLCEMQKQNCRIQARHEAMWEYGKYQRDSAGRFGSRTLNSFDKSWRCNQPCHCQENYRACFTSCGGQVIANTICVANCDKK